MGGARCQARTKVNCPILRDWHRGSGRVTRHRAHGLTQIQLSHSGYRYRWRMCVRRSASCASRGWSESWRPCVFVRVHNGLEGQAWQAGALKWTLMRWPRALSWYSLQLMLDPGKDSIQKFTHARRPGAAIESGSAARRGAARAVD